MNWIKLNSIDDVISVLEEIISFSENNNDPMGYFAALYQKVTIQVKHGIKNQIFENGPRMEKLDIIFAKRFIDAWECRQNKLPLTQSWEKAFVLAESNRPLVLQHLLMGMNAHINLDLGIAAAEISTGKNISELQHDFNKINEILSTLVNEVQNNLSVIWPMLKEILSIFGKVDNLLVDFSMELARKGAWKSVTELSKLSGSAIHDYMLVRDKKVADKSKLITNPGRTIQFLFWIIRLGERGTVADKIRQLKNQIN